MSTTTNTTTAFPTAEEIKKGYGPHLTYDGYNCPNDKMTNMTLVFNFLKEMPEILGMNKLTQPYVLISDGGDKPEDWGITGVVIICESHISVHTYPEDNTFFLDVFSCKPFDINKALDYIRKTFQAGKEDLNLVVRGKEFRQG